MITLRKFILTAMFFMSLQCHGNVTMWFDHASKEVGIDKILLYTFGFKESSLKPIDGKSSLFEFKEKTFRWLLYEYGNDYEGLAMDADINDLFTQTMLAAIYIKRNKESLESFLGREPTIGELYMAHLLGLSGAKRLLGSNLDNLAKDVVSYAYNKGNRRWFVTRSKKYRTVSQFRDYINYSAYVIYNSYTEPN